MSKMTGSTGMSYLKYVIPVVIAAAVVLFILLKGGLEKRQEAEKIAKEAEKHIEAIKEKPKEPIDLKTADHFVDAQAVLATGDRQVVETTPKSLFEDPSIGAKSTIKVLVEEEKAVITTPRELLKRPTVTEDTPIRVLTEDGRVVETTPRKLLAEGSITQDTPIKIIEKVEKVLVTTPEELVKRGLGPETPIKVIAERPAELVTLSQVLPDERGGEEDLFYIHAVTEADVQGIWGIIQHGLMERFLKGVPMAIEEEGARKQVLTLEIPGDADERRQNGYSSFLGRMLVEKTRESYAYNHTNGRMGRNPDHVVPGQEIVIIRFSKKELVEIYRHFRQTSG